MEAGYTISKLNCQSQDDFAGGLCWVELRAHGDEDEEEDDDNDHGHSSGKTNSSLWRYKPFATEHLSRDKLTATKQTNNGPVKQCWSCNVTWLTNF